MVDWRRELIFVFKADSKKNMRDQRVAKSKLKDKRSTARIAQPFQKVSKESSFISNFKKMHIKLPNSPICIANSYDFLVAQCTAPIQIFFLFTFEQEVLLSYTLYTFSQFMLKN